MNVGTGWQYGFVEKILSACFLLFRAELEGLDWRKV